MEGGASGYWTTPVTRSSGSQPLGFDSLALRGHSNLLIFVDIALGAHQSSGDRRVDISIDQHEIGLMLDHHSLESLHYLRGLLRVGSGTNLEIDVGRADSQFLKENVRHVEVVVLASMNDGLANAWISVQSSNDRSNLHEVRSCPNYVNDVHGT